MKYKKLDITCVCFGDLHNFRIKKKLEQMQNKSSKLSYYSSLYKHKCF